MLVAALALGACGGDNEERNRYVRELNVVQKRYADTVEKISVTKTSSVRQDERSLARYEAAITDTVVALRGISAPPEVASEHRRFVSVWVRLRDDVAQASEAIRNPTPRGIERAQRRIATANDLFNEGSRRASAAIDAKLGA